MSEMSKANRRYWDSLARDWEKLRDRDRLWQKILHQPELAFEGEALEMIGRFLGDLKDKRACVLASGDNYVAFALAGMGAQVTSTDISEQQLQVARKRAAVLGLDIEFICTDAAALDGIQDSHYDLVCSSNGFFVWVADPARVFQQVYRVLNQGGCYIFYDLHPFQRPWNDQVSPLEMEKPYEASGPFEYKESGLTSYEFHWRLSDLINPLLEAGLVLRGLAESPAKDSRFWEGVSYEAGQDKDLLDWRKNPRAGLPVWLTLAAQKPG